MQVNPIKPALKALKVPGTERLELIYDGPLSTFAFNFNLRRYGEASPTLAMSKTISTRGGQFASDGAPSRSASRARLNLGRT